MSGSARQCPCCFQQQQHRPFYRSRQQPVNSVVLCSTREWALNITRADIDLCYCIYCGCIFNGSFDSTLCRYDREYEESQSHSPTFSAFSRELAEMILAGWPLKGKTVVEIGCGKGDFLNLICTMTDCRGIGYDPSYVPERAMGELPANVAIHAHKYPFDLGGVRPDCIVCKMTLEHISDAGVFLQRLRQGLPLDGDIPVVFLVPNMRSIVEKVRFWDVYYEHCGYYTAMCLTNLFEKAGFSIHRVETLYESQYLFLEAGIRLNENGPSQKEKMEDFQNQLRRFSSMAEQRRQNCLRKLEKSSKRGGRAVLWGGGSKAVSFVSHLCESELIDCIVDINPHKQEKFLPGSGHRIVSPRTLVGRVPDLVVAMNPMYRNEITEILAAQGMTTNLLTVDELANAE